MDGTWQWLGRGRTSRGALARMRLLSAARRAPGAPSRSGGVLAASGAGRGGDVVQMDALGLSIPSNQFFFPVLAANAAVYFAWQTAFKDGATGRGPRILNSVFMTSPGHLRGLPWFAAPVHWLGSSFSHVGGFHLAVNMFALHSFSKGLLSPDSDYSPKMGLARFTATYLAGGLAGGFASNMWGLAIRSSTPSLGASGAVFAVATAYLQSVPGAGVLLFFVAPLSGGQAVMVLGGLNVALMAAQALRFRVSIDGAGHLGGMLAGVLAAEAWRASDDWRGQVRRSLRRAGADHAVEQARRLADGGRSDPARVVGRAVGDAVTGPPRRRDDDTER